MTEAAKRNFSRCEAKVVKEKWFFFVALVVFLGGAFFCQPAERPTKIRLQSYATSVTYLYAGLEAKYHFYD